MHNFINPDLIERLQAAGHTIKTYNHGHMNLFTAGRREMQPLNEARLGLDIERL